MAMRFTTFKAASSGQRCTCAPRSAAPAKPRAAAETTVPSPSLKDIATSLKNTRTKQGGK